MCLFCELKREIGGERERGGKREKKDMVREIFWILRRERRGKKREGARNYQAPNGLFSLIF